MSYHGKSWNQQACDERLWKGTFGNALTGYGEKKRQLPTNAVKWLSRVRHPGNAITVQATVVVNVKRSINQRREAGCWPKAQGSLPHRSLFGKI